MKFSSDISKATQLFYLLRFLGTIGVGILLTKSSLSLTAINLYETLIFIGFTLTFFWINGLLEGILPTYPKLDTRHKKHFLFNVFVLFSGLGLVLFFILLLAKTYLIQVLTHQTTLPLYNYFAIFICLNIPTFLIEYIYILENKPLGLSRYSVFFFLGLVAAVCIPPFLGLGLKWSIYGLIVFASIKLIWLFFLLKKYALPTTDFKLLSPYLLLSLPLVLRGAIGGADQVIDGTIVHWFFKEEGVFAIFKYGAREFPLLLVLTGALRTAFIPFFIKISQQSLAEFRAKTTQIMHQVFPICMVLLWTSTFLFPIIFNADFKESASIFNVFLLIGLSRILLPSVFFIAQKDTTVLVYISIAELLLNFILSILFIPIFGLVGVAYATLIAYFFEKVISIFFVQKKYNIRLKEYLNLSVYGIYVAIISLSYFLQVFQVF